MVFGLGFEVEVEVLEAWETEGGSKAGGGRDGGRLKVEDRDGGQLNQSPRKAVCRMRRSSES